MTWLIERASRDDIGAMMDVEHSAFVNPWTREMYVSEFDNTGVSFFSVARDPETGGALVGFCSFWRVLDELHINNLAVVPAKRRQGVASALLNSVLEEGTHQGAFRATLEVRQSNEVALKLYERFGFSVAGVRRNYYSHPVEDALVLWRDKAAGSS